jgi:hypothetical protein
VRVCGHSNTDTANLAAFITISSRPGLLATSVDDVMSNRKALCAVDSGSLLRFDASFPRATYTRIRSTTAAAEALVGGRECSGVLAGHNVYSAWRTDPAYCKFQVAQLVFGQEAGWMTGRQNTCVRDAFEWALLQLQANGTMNQIMERHFPTAPCGVTRAGRRLASTVLEQSGEEGSTLGPTPDAYASAEDMEEDVEEEARMASGRGLQSSGSSSGSSPTSPSSSVSQTTQFELWDFLGLYAMWVIATVLVLLSNTMQACQRRWKTRRAAVGGAQPQSTDEGNPTLLLERGGQRRGSRRGSVEGVRVREQQSDAGRTQARAHRGSLLLRHINYDDGGSRGIESSIESACACAFARRDVARRTTSRASMCAGVCAVRCALCVCRGCYATRAAASNE